MNEVLNRRTIKIIAVIVPNLERIVQCVNKIMIVFQAVNSKIQVRFYGTVFSSLSVKLKGS